MNYIMNMNKLKEKRNWISLRVHNRPTKEILYTMIFWFAKMTYVSHLAVGMKRITAMLTTLPFNSFKY